MKYMWAINTYCALYKLNWLVYSSLIFNKSVSFHPWQESINKHKHVPSVNNSLSQQCRMRNDSFFVMKKSTPGFFSVAFWTNESFSNETSLLNHALLPTKWYKVTYATLCMCVDINFLLLLSFWWILLLLKLKLL